MYHTDAIQQLDHLEKTVCAAISSAFVSDIPLNEDDEFAFSCIPQEVITGIVKEDGQIFVTTRNDDDDETFKYNIIDDAIPLLDKIRVLEIVELNNQIKANEPLFITWATIWHGTHKGCDIAKALKKYQQDPTAPLAFENVVDAVIEVDHDWKESWTTYLNESIQTIKK